MYKNHTAVLYNATAGGVCSFCRLLLLFNTVCFLESVASALTGANMYDVDMDKSSISIVLSSGPSVEKLSF